MKAPALNALLRCPSLGLAIASVVVAIGPGEACAQPVAAEPTTRAMRDAAAAWLDTLGPALRDGAAFAFDSPVRRDWHFVPKPRPGVSLGQMDLAQRGAADALLRTALSDRGYLKVTTIMSLERVLGQMEADRPGGGAHRDPERYWLAVFGDPGGEADSPWGWRLEGHHVSLNFTSAVVDRPATPAPWFLGANPAEVRVGPRRGLRALGEEDTLGVALMASLDARQQAVATIATLAPDDVAGVPGAPPGVDGPAGLSADAMNAAQRRRLWRLVESFARVHRPAIAGELLEEIDRAGRDRLHFAWAGPPPGARSPGDSAAGSRPVPPREATDAVRHYFRVHGPTFVLEYDYVNPNHVHAVWHSTRDDFGRDTLRRHYAAGHSGG